MTQKRNKALVISGEINNRLPKKVLKGLTNERLTINCAELYRTELTILGTVYDAVIEYNKGNINITVLPEKAVTR